MSAGAAAQTKEPPKWAVLPSSRPLPSWAGMAQTVETQIGTRGRVVGPEALLAIVDLTAVRIGGGIAGRVVIARVVAIAVRLRSADNRAAHDRAGNTKPRAGKSAVTI